MAGIEDSADLYKEGGVIDVFVNWNCKHKSGLELYVF